jgi:hypothetical protein
MVAMDANFRLKSRLRGAINREPTLGLGWSYFVNNGPYADFIKDYVDQDEVRFFERCLIYKHYSPTADSDMCRFPSDPQHAHKEVEGLTRDRYGSS